VILKGEKKVSSLFEVVEVQKETVI